MDIRWSCNACYSPHPLDSGPSYYTGCPGEVLAAIPFRASSMRVTTVLQVGAIHVSRNLCHIQVSHRIFGANRVESYRVVHPQCSASFSRARFRRRPTRFVIHIISISYAVINIAVFRYGIRAVLALPFRPMSKTDKEEHKRNQEPVL